MTRDPAEALAVAVGAAQRLRLTEARPAFRHTHGSLHCLGKPVWTVSTWLARSSYLLLEVVGGLSARAVLKVAL